MNTEQISENIFKYFKWWLSQTSFARCVNHDFILRSEAFIVKGILLWKTTCNAKPGWYLVSLLVIKLTKYFLRMIPNKLNRDANDWTTNHELRKTCNTKHENIEWTCTLGKILQYSYQNIKLICILLIDNQVTLAFKKNTISRQVLVQSYRENPRLMGWIYNIQCNI